ncbi:unnamed protein product, partial [Cuscuta campestris]
MFHLSNIEDVSSKPICLPDGSRVQAVKQGSVHLSSSLDHLSKIVIGQGDLRNGVYVFASSPASALVANIDPLVLHKR